METNQNTTNNNMEAPINIDLGVTPSVTLQSAYTNTFRLYDSALTIPMLKGFRSVKLLYKKHPKTGKSLAENSYIRVQDYLNEQLIVDRITEIAPYVVGYLQAEEDKLIKSYHIAGATTVKESDLNLQVILTALEESTVSQRLNKEKIEEWFKSKLQDDLMKAIATKSSISLEEPTEEEVLKLDTILTAYRDKFSAMAGGKTYYRKEEAQMLLQALSVSESAGASFISNKLRMKLDVMMTDTPDTLLMSL